MEMNGGQWGETIRVNVHSNGHVWVFHRCFNALPFAHATCVGRETVPPILEFDQTGKLVNFFGQGMFAYPHGFTVDRDGNIWASDVLECSGDGPNGCTAEGTVLGVSAKATAGPFKGQLRGHTVFKLSPDGKVLLTIGKPGVAGNGHDTFDRPSGVITAANGDVFVTDGHGKNDRVVKFTKEGTYIKEWGHHGSGPGEFNQPHDIAMDSRGRLFIADRGNNRVQIFDQEGNFVDAWKQFGRPSAVSVGPDDTLYVSDSQSNSRTNPGRSRGIYIGSAKSGAITAFIPDPDLNKAEELGISGGSGIAADAAGSIYVADIEPHKLRKYIKR
jgi:sugar lactone lactonase YvrE